MEGHLLFLVCFCVLAHGTYSDDALEQQLNASLAQLGRQLMLQQLFVEERIRSDGDSGMKTIRLNSLGPRPYYAESVSSKRKVCAIHNHDNNIRTVGMGEFIAVLNGVEFRTRHNDYRLYMPSTTSKKYNATENIPFPEVPDDVTQYTEVDDQVKEMREYFLAFKTQNTTHRDYRPYFKPVLCYLEGSWTTSPEVFSFESDRHFTDAESWYDLQEKIRFTSYTGRKSLLENFSYLPTTVIDFVDGTIPITAQWNYRILCHPLKNDLPTNRLRVIDDLATRMRDNTNFYALTKSRAARFQVNPVDSDEWTTATPSYQFLDDLMGEVPGKDNYGANITDSILGATAFPLRGDQDKPLNVGYYHRAFRLNVKDAMGLNSRRRGFNDQNVFMAATTHPEVAPTSATFCEGNGKKKKCKEYTERWTYAIPLEIIYLTPQASWNPYNLDYKGAASSDEAKTVTADGRNGEEEKALNGTHSKLFYRTPSHFYSGSDAGENDPADTSTCAKWVLDPSGTPQKVCNSGVRILMRPISGDGVDVGTVRQRYPIMPLHDDGNTIYKELEALKDIVLEPKKYAHMLRGEAVVNSDQGLTLKMTASSAATGAHEHFVDLTGHEVELLYEGDSLRKETSEAHGHRHTVVVVQGKDKDTGKIFYKFKTCDGELKCPDRHGVRFIVYDSQPTTTT